MLTYQRQQRLHAYCIPTPPFSRSPFNSRVHPSSPPLVATPLKHLSFPEPLPSSMSCPPQQCTEVPWTSGYWCASCPSRCHTTVGHLSTRSSLEVYFSGCLTSEEDERSSRDRKNSANEINSIFEYDIINRESPIMMRVYWIVLISSFLKSYQVITYKKNSKYIFRATITLTNTESVKQATDCNLK